MARRKKVVINTEELTPTVLATVKNKTGSIIGFILVFAIFGAIVYFLPTITEYVDNFLHPKATNTQVPKNKQTGTTTDTDTIEEEKTYSFNNNPVITEEDFSLSDFTILNGSLQFRVNNFSNTVLNLDDYNYYLELYNAEDTLIQRIKVDDAKVKEKGSLLLSYKLDNLNISYMSFKEIKTTEYHAYTKDADVTGPALLTCTKDNETINYFLSNNKLTKIEDIYTAFTSDINYENLFNTYQSLANTYQNLNGVTSTIVTDVNGLVFTTSIDLSINDKVTISKIIYPKDTDAKVMYFEMNARGYNCK